MHQIICKVYVDGRDGPKGSRGRLYWTGKAWSETAADAQPYETREDAATDHGMLVKRTPPAGSSTPLIVEIKG